jgi:methyl-accepting chemotaxis protein
MPKFEIKKRNLQSLTVTLTLAFLIFSIVVLLFASGLEIYFSYTSQQVMIANEQQLIAQDAAAIVKNFIQEKIGIMERSIAIGRIDSSSPEDQKIVLEKLLGKVPSFRQMVLTDAEQQELATASRLSESVSGKLKEQIVGDVFSKLKTANAYIGSVYIDETSQEPMIVLAVPVKDVFGDAKGTLIAEVNLKFMWDLVSSMKIGKNGLAYVVDRKGNLIAFGDITRVLKGENLVVLKEVKEFIDNEEQVAVADAVKGINGTDVVSTFVPLGSPDWAVIIELPTTEAYATIIKMLKFSLWSLLGNFILVVIVGFSLSRRITKPIVALRDAVQEISSGKLNVKIKTESKNEIGELASNFNDMAAKLKELYETLEAKVRERTRELNEKEAELEAKIEEMERFHKLTMGREEKILELKKKVREFEEESKAIKQKNQV